MKVNDGRSQLRTAGTVAVGEARFLSTRTASNGNVQAPGAAETRGGPGVIRVPVLKYNHRA